MRRASRVVPGLSRALASLVLACAMALAPLPALAASRVVIVEGLGGEPIYSVEFAVEARAIAAASRTLILPANVHVLVGASATRASVLAYFHNLARATSPDDRLILYLVGHGSYDGRQYKFNIPGPDLTGEDLAALLNALPAQQQLVVATGSSSGALLPLLQRSGRLLITATRNGEEKNATRFGAAFAAALTSTAADTDKDGAISAQEAYNFANRRVQDEYRAQTLLATEHAVLQGDGGAHFTLAALTPTIAAADGAAAGSAAGAGGAPGGATSAPGVAAAVPPALLHERAALNARIQALEQRKGTLAPAEYSTRLEQLLLQLAQLQERIDQHAAGDHGGTH